MKRLVLFLFLAAAGCTGDDPLGVDGLCSVGLFANDIFYAPREELVAATAVSQEPVFHITRYDPECYDQGQAHEFVNGESNFLTVGTPIHEVIGFGPLARLAYFDARVDGWRPLFPVQACGGPSGTAARTEVERPCSTPPQAR